MATRTGVSVFTWGSKTYTSDPIEYDTGMSHFAETTILGGNVGHASILLTLPDTEENRQMVSTYLKGTSIPVESKKYETKEARLEEGKFVKTDKTAYEESVIEVYFSWWPNDDVHGFAFNTFAQDCIAERRGVDTKYDQKWSDYLEPDVRRATSGIKSLLPNSTIKLRPAHFVHDRGQSPEELKLLQSAQAGHFYENLYESAFRLWRKLDEQANAGRTNPRLGASDEMILKKIFPGQSVNNTDLNALRSQILDRLNDLTEQANASKFEFIRTLVSFNPTVADLSEPEREIYNRIQNVRTLNKIINNKAFAALSPYEKSQAKNFIEGAYPGRFPDGVTSDNYSEILALTIQDCDRKNVNGLAHDHNEILGRGDILQINECIQGIDDARELYARIEAYETASEADKERARQGIITAIEKIPSLNLLFNSPDSPLKVQEIPIIKASAGNLISPSKGRHFKKINEITSYPGNDINTLLLNDRTRVILQEGMSEGHRPSHKVEIPFRSDIANGLDPEAILQQMALFANQGSAFNLVNNNCSVTSSAILARGAREHGWVFEQGAFSHSIANPQMVYNNAMQFVSTKKEELIPPAISWYASTQNYLAETSINYVAEATKPEASHLSRIGNVLGALSSGIFASAMMFVNALGTSSEAHFEDLAPIPPKRQTSDYPSEVDSVASSSSVTKEQSRRHSLTWSYEDNKDEEPASGSDPVKDIEEKIEYTDKKSQLKPD